MVLDVGCIILALIARIIHIKRFEQFVRKITLGRYLDLQTEDIKLDNVPFELFDDMDKINQTLDSNSDIYTA